MSIYHTGNQMSNTSPDDQTFYCRGCGCACEVNKDCPNGCDDEQAELEIEEAINEQND